MAEGQGQHLPKRSDNASFESEIHSSISSAILSSVLRCFFDDTSTSEISRDGVSIRY